MRIKSFFSFLVLACLVFTITSCGSGGPKGTSGNPVKLGVVQSSDMQWTVLKDGLLKEGIYVDIVNFTDYTSENPALSRGELDINEFQHLDYLANYNVQTNSDLVPIGATAIFPIGLYPNKAAGVNQLSDIQDGSTIVIPNDDTNQSRAINLLADNGLISLKDKKKSVYTPNVIEKASSKVNVKSVQANQAAHSLSDKSVAAAVINNDFLSDADVNPKDAILKESAHSDFAKRFINVWVVQKKDSDDLLLNKIVNWASGSREFLGSIAHDNSGTAQIVSEDYEPSKLQEILSDLQKEKVDE
ncbi:MAG: ABC transporter substrate-binding protein [Bifidobacteriaceae bacterium]|jgi:D-methionine transport system substrate-binding protein|nr:ABC transporter substrate-binding protein [Bifidobacteriaceae bacterium]